MQDTIAKLSLIEIDLTMKILRTAYYIAKNIISYTDHPDLIELQTLNGNNLGIGLRSRFCATNLIGHIAHEMRYKICTHIKQIEGKISILLDESTTLSNLSCFLIYLRCETAKDNSPHYLFPDLIELEIKISAAIVNNILTCLTKYEFYEDYLMRNLVALSTNGASVMSERKCRVATTLA